MRYKNWGLIALFIFGLTACAHLPESDPAVIETDLASTVFVGLTQTVDGFTETPTQEPTLTMIPTEPVTPTVAIIVTVMPTAKSTAAYSGPYTYYTATTTPTQTLTFTPTVTGPTITLTPTITSTSYGVSWMCIDPDRSILQGEGCASFCAYYAASVEAGGNFCYSYGKRVLAAFTATAAPTAIPPTAAPTAVPPTAVPTAVPPTAIPPTAVPTEVPTAAPSDQTGQG